MTYLLGFIIAALVMIWLELASIHQALSRWTGQDEPD